MFAVVPGFDGAAVVQQVELAPALREVVVESADVVVVAQHVVVVVLRRVDFRVATLSSSLPPPHDARTSARTTAMRSFID
jgi:hypothetical protein